MATHVEAGSDSEERFFFIMACAMAATIVAGFALNLAMGRSSFSVPLVFHLHAAVFFGWVILYLSQNALVASGNVALHRRMGWLAAIWVPALVAMGITMTVVSLRRNGGPPFFDMREFLVGNPLQLLCFAGLVTAAIARRKQTDWHRRLMLCAMAILTGPGLGRLLPMPLLIPWAWWIASLATLVFPLTGMLADRRRNGRVHPAWFYGIAASLGTLVLGEVVSHTPVGDVLVGIVTAGTPGAERQVTAHMP
jgi:hypothetical protein